MQSIPASFASNGVVAVDFSESLQKSPMKISDRQALAAREARAFELGAPNGSLNDVMVDGKEAGIAFPLTCCVFVNNAERRPNAEDDLQMCENMRKVLAIEDDELVSRNVVRTLNANGFIVDVARTGRNGVERAMDDAYDAVILDRELPDLDGVTVVATLRGIGIRAPMLMMSSACHADQRIEGLRAGADDYMSMPISFDEMLARVEVLLRRQPVLRRQPAVTAAPSVLRSGGLELDLVKRTVIHRQSQLGLRPTEFRLLEFMMRHAGQVRTRTMILEAVWDCHFNPGTNLIDVHVGHLRQKLSMLGLPPMIRTIRGSGYRFG